VAIGVLYARLPRPKPIKTVEVQPPYINGTTDHEQWERAAEAKRAKLQRNIGPHFYVERTAWPDHDYSGPPQWKTLLNVWRGEDWRDHKTAAYYPAEIPQHMSELNHEIYSREWQPSYDGKKGAARSVATRKAKRGDCIENHRAEFEQAHNLRRSYRGAAMLMKQKSPAISFNVQAIARYFKKHPTPAKM